MSIMSVVYDDASNNQRIFNMHDSGNNMDYKILSLCRKSKNLIFFITDPCHLIRAIRNCSAKGMLWVNDVDSTTVDHL